MPQSYNFLEVFNDTQRMNFHGSAAQRIEAKYRPPWRKDGVIA